MARKLGPAPFLSAAALFAAGVTIVGIWMTFSAAEVDRLMTSGKRAAATITGKEIQPGRRSDTYWSQFDVDGRSQQRQVPRTEWEKLKIGDRMTYYYDPAEPELGLVEPQLGASRDVSGVFIAGSFLVGPLLLVAIFLWWRQRWTR